MLEYLEKLSWLGPLLILYLIFDYFIRKSNRKAEQDKINWEFQKLRTQRSTAVRFYLETLQRELANIILREDIEALEKAFYSIRDWEREIIRSNKERREAEYKLLLEKFPNLEDFDVVGTKHFIRYDHRPSWSIEEVVERYKEVTKFLILARYQDEEEAKFYQSQFDDREVDIFRQRIQSYKDSRLQNQMENAMKSFHKWGRFDEQDTYEDNEYQVTMLWRQPERQLTPDNQYGIYCKKLDEYGIYSSFSAEGDKVFRSYYRSDSAFLAQNSLWTH